MLRTIQTGAGQPVRCLATFGSRFTYQSQPMSQLRVENHYQVLNVPVGSSDREIRRAFIELSKKYHPDSNSQTRDSEVFMKICEAYQTLHRVNSRQIYDSRLRMQNQNKSPQESTFTGRRVYTVWSQYQSAVRSKQMGRGSRRFGGVKSTIFKGKVVNKWLPMTLVDLMREGHRGSWHDEYSFPNSPIFYLYVAGFCLVGGLVLLDVISRFQKQSFVEKDIKILLSEKDLEASTITHPIHPSA
ncbi:chaperone protein DnaJ 2 [Drosophila sechellia]|uniref:GM25957 n=1 Tax=Drosophila sechellia TaxID=7238 RepID=B4HGA1_DROSE|nr:chaperone protein DnaJ 2 [Drosophila sechellia]EDW42349.1 GM25957 [Drosophila sechellia]